MDILLRFLLFRHFRGHTVRLLMLLTAYLGPRPQSLSAPQVRHVFIESNVKNGQPEAILGS